MLCDTKYEVKKIYIFLNGFKYAPCKKMVINSRKLYVWMRILDEISAMFGYIIMVTRLFRVQDGFEVVNFNQLLDRGCYVASDSKNFLNIGYCDNRKKQRYVNMYSDCSLWFKNIQNNLIDVRSDLLVIYVIKNYTMNTKPPKIVLSKRDLKNWNQVLSFIDKKLDLHGEITKFLYTLNGKIICGPWELQHGGLYIAVGNSNKYYPWECCDINYAKHVWKFGTPFYSKPKLEICYHKKYSKMESWKQDINWKRFNQRYVDQIIDCIECQSRHLCMPVCNCQDINRCKTSSYQNKSSDLEQDNESLSNTLRIQKCCCEKPVHV